MKNMRISLSVLCALACLASARANLTMTLSPSTQIGPRGTEIVFSGTLTNTSATAKVFLNDIHAILGTGSSAYLTFEPNAFYSNVPGILLPGESYSNSELFRVLLSAMAPAGDYHGTIFVTGGGDMVANSDLASGGFVVSSPWKIVSATRLANSHLLLQCFGVANATNTIQAAPDLMTPFTTLAHVAADANGAFQYEDVDAGGLSSRFYQLVYP